MGTIPRPQIHIAPTVTRGLLAGEQFILLSQGSDLGTPLLSGEDATPMVLGEIYE